MALSKLWFHDGAGGNSTGIGDAMRTLDLGGIPFFMMSASDAGVVFEAQQLAKASGVPHRLLYRHANDDSDPYNYDVPDYGLSPADAQPIHWTAHMLKWPAELDPRLVYIQTINECDKNRAEWLAEFEYYNCQKALAEDRRYACFGWSAGEPEPEHWEGPWMLALLELASDHPDRVAIALHEYSYVTDNLTRLYPYLVGRFQALYDVADAYGLRRPTVLVTEFGWTYQNIPGVGQAMEVDLPWAAALYAEHPEVLGAAIWYLGSGFGGIDDQTQKLIEPLTEYALKNYFVIPKD